MSEKLSLREKILISVCCVMFLSVFFEGRGISSADAKSPNSDLYEELQVFTDVLAIVQSDYVTKPENNDLVSGAIKGMLTTLDPHSSYLKPDFYKDFEMQSKGEFGGLGIEITVKDGLLTVVSPMEDSPAQKAGVKTGDAIIKIEGEYTKDFSLIDAVSKLRGPRGSAVNISVKREKVDGLIDIKVVRDVVKLKSVKKRYLGDGYGYVRLAQFMESTSSDLKKALEFLKKKNDGKELSGLVIDVRNNPGGLLTQAIRVSDLFLKEGIIVYTEGRVKKQKQKFYANDTGDEPEYPIIVLINGGSASASEILAGAFKDHGRALVLGTQSFGKGSVQTITPLNNGGAVTLTTALYYTKSGNSLQAKGVKPDIEVEQEEIEDEQVKKGNRRRVRESELPGAIHNPDGDNDPIKKINKTPTIATSSKPVNPEEDSIEEWRERDTQFNRAYDLLKTFNIFKPEVVTFEKN